MVHRISPLYLGDLRGHFLLTRDVIDNTRVALRQFYEAGAYEGGHEGICFWAGREEPNLTRFRNRNCATCYPWQISCLHYGSAIWRSS